jgi:hypothetical protein
VKRADTVDFVADDLYSCRATEAVSLVILMVN